ncbi:MAG: hypothetical protein ACUVXJ_16035 [Phycisphaerae bacterium]
MIKQILVVGQGPNDLGFLEGLCDCLGCRAELVDYRKDPGLRQRGTYTKKRDAKLIWQRFRNVDLIVRLTDGDTNRPREARRTEEQYWPEEARSLLIVGVCDRDLEHWLCLDPGYVGRVLDFDPGQLPPDREARSGFIKRRIRLACPDGDYRKFVRRIVSDAPSETLKRWLANGAFAEFYEQCRDAARQHCCVVANLRD